MSCMQVCRTMAFFAMLVSAGSMARALEIEHQPAACAFAGRHPRIAARVPGAGAGTSVRVYFQRSDDPDWYAVMLRQDGEIWSAALPRPQASVRFRYFLVAREGAQLARSPESAAFLVEAAAACYDDVLPVSEEGPSELQVPLGAARVPAGFARTSIGSYVGYTTDIPMPPSMVPEFRGVPVSRRVRVLLAGSGLRGDLVEGTVASWNADSTLLALRGKKETLRVRNEDILAVSVRDYAPPGHMLLGGVAGGAGGLALGFLFCMVVPYCAHPAVIWIPGVVGVAVGFSGSTHTWKPIYRVQRGRFALALERPRHGEAAVGVSLRF